jgi:hypothetical protein
MASGSPSSPSAYKSGRYRLPAHFASVTTGSPELRPFGQRPLLYFRRFLCLRGDCRCAAEAQDNRPLTILGGGGGDWVGGGQAKTAVPTSATVSTNGKMAFEDARQLAFAISRVPKTSTKRPRIRSRKTEPQR